MIILLILMFMNGIILYLGKILEKHLWEKSAREWMKIIRKMEMLW